MIEFDHTAKPMNDTARRILEAEREKAKGDLTSWIGSRPEYERKVWVANEDLVRCQERIRKARERIIELDEALGGYTSLYAPPKP